MILPTMLPYCLELLPVDALICWSLEPSLCSLFMKPIYKCNRRVYHRNIITDFAYKVLMLNLISDQLYKPTNIRSNVKWSTFQYDHCSNVGGSDPIRSNMSNQCEFPIGRNNEWEVPMQWTNGYQANGCSVWPMVNQWWSEVWTFVLAYIRANGLISRPNTEVSGCIWEYTEIWLAQKYPERSGPIC